MKNFKRNLLNSLDITVLLGNVMLLICILVLIYANYLFCNLFPFTNIAVYYKFILIAGFFAPAAFFIFKTTDSVLRTMDILLSSLGLIFLSPVFISISLWIKFNSKGPVFFAQQRVGKDDKDFNIYKFRTMKLNAQQYGALTVGSNDYRITRVGYYLRKYKLDELPQLFNVLKGEMSLVGPRPEVRKYVDLYDDEQRKILGVRPGITDYASIEYRNESDLLKTVQNPEAFYIDEVMPAKIELSKYYIENKGIRSYFTIIAKTFFGMSELTKALSESSFNKKVTRPINIIPAESVPAATIYYSNRA